MKDSNTQHNAGSDPRGGSTDADPSPVDLSLTPRIATIALLVACVGGTFFRFYRLGASQLSTIEFYLVTSARAILETGLPGLPGGGYYHAGLTAQYAVAASAFLFGENEFAVRLPGVLFSLGTVALVYAFARPRVGHILASSVCVALLLSSWEIEFARLARPYAMFQFVTVLLLFSMDSCWWRGRGRLRYLPHALVGVAALTSEFPPVLLPLLLLPYLAPDTILATKRDKLHFGAVTAAVAIAVSLFSLADFRTLGVPSPLPVGVMPEVRDWLRLPVFPFWSLNDSQAQTFALLIGTIASVIATFYLLQRRRALPLTKDLIGSLLVVTALFHTFVLSAGMAALLVLRYRVWFRFREQGRALMAISLAGVLGLAWIVRALVRDDWLAATGRALGYESLAGGLRITFFGWPDFFESLLVPWTGAMPTLGAFLAVACFAELLYIVGRSRREIAENPAVVLIMLATAMGVWSFEDRSLGSSFFFYPLALVVVATVMSRIAQVVASHTHDRWRSAIQVSAAIAFLGPFAVSQDFNSRHLLNIGSQEVALRVGEFQSYASIWSARNDIRSPAIFLASAVEEGGDDLIVVQGIAAASRYLSPPYAVYYSRDEMRFPRVSRAAGTMDVWSKQRLLSTDADLRALCEATSTLWVIRRRGDDPAFCRGVWPAVRDNLAYEGADERIDVIRLDRIEAPSR